MDIEKATGIVVGEGIGGGVGEGVDGGVGEGIGGGVGEGVGGGVGERVGGGVGSTTGATLGDRLGGGDGAGVSGAIVGASLGTRGQNSRSGGPRSDCETTENQECDCTYFKYVERVLTNLVQPALCPSNRTG
jgi:hypothetical protein